MTYLDQGNPVVIIRGEEEDERWICLGVSSTLVSHGIVSRIGR
jgi:hypothetical protein